MGIFDLFKKKDSSKNKIKSSTETANLKEEYIDDITYIRAISHVCSGPWNQYDILLASKGYGWEYMINWADYMATADLENISQVTTGNLASEEIEITKAYKSNNNKCLSLPELETENGVLSIAGISKTLGAPMKIVWINQTNTLRLFTIIDDETLIRKYVETLVRRTFGTKNEMKLGKPIPEEM